MSRLIMPERYIKLPDGGIAWEPDMLTKLNDAVNQLREVLSRESDYALDMYFSRTFSEVTGRPETEVLGVLRGATDSLLASDQSRRHDKYAHAQRTACELMTDWLEDSAHLVGELSTDDLIHRVATRKIEHTYCTLVGLSLCLDGKPTIAVG